MIIDPHIKIIHTLNMFTYIKLRSKVLKSPLNSEKENGSKYVAQQN